MNIRSYQNNYIDLVIRLAYNIHILWRKDKMITVDKIDDLGIFIPKKILVELGIMEAIILVTKVPKNGEILAKCIKRFVKLGYTEYYAALVANLLMKIEQLYTSAENACVGGINDEELRILVARLGLC